jgi:hypothetical protein
MQLSPHFSLEEFTFSETAARLGIDNQPSAELLETIQKYLVPGLEIVRTLLHDNSMHINSGYRSVELNIHIPGSSNTSAHTLGYAADIVCPLFGDPWDICNYIAQTEIKFDQIIYEYARWMHISFDPRLRDQCLTKLAGQPYRLGFHRE